MAAPTEATIKNLNGTWAVDYDKSDPTDPLLTLQGIGWLTRKAIGLAYITVEVKQYPDETNKDTHHIDIKQYVTGGIEGTTELRTTDNATRQHEDHIFGKVEGQSKFFRGSKSPDGKVRPNLAWSTAGDDEKVHKFLNGEVAKDGSESGEGWVVEDLGGEFGEGEGLWLQSFVKSVDSTWTAEQIWGFELIDGERYYTRRIVVANNGSYELARLVYSWTPPPPELAEDEVIL